MNNITLYKANEDILCIMHNVHSIGWSSLRELSIQRILYLSKVLYYFVHKDDSNIFDYYHFTTTLLGPYSQLISSSIVDLEANEYLEEENNGEIILLKNYPSNFDQVKLEWLTTIIYILGKYGEKRIFGFILKDPVYQDSVDNNSQKDLDTSPDNRTIIILKQFEEAFQKTLKDTSMISSKEYLELYFDYVFSLIIK